MRHEKVWWTCDNPKCNRIVENPEEIVKLKTSTIQNGKLITSQFYLCIECFTNIFVSLGIELTPTVVYDPEEEFQEELDFDEDQDVRMI